MKGIFWRLRFVPLIMFLLGGSVVVPTEDGSTTSAASQDQEFKTVITVDSTDDPDDSRSRTCGFTGGVFSARTPCTLRRALIEAGARPASDRPILIQFNIPQSDPNFGLEVDGTWTVQVNRANLVLRDQISSVGTDGRVTIDGDTQPGGRADGPKIIIDTNDHAFEIGSYDNTIENVSIKGGGSVSVTGNRNTIENIWMGLSDDGMSLAFKDSNRPEDLADGGILFSGDNNVIHNSVITGATGRAINLSGNDNQASNNFIGTRADGTVPRVRSRIKCLRSVNYDENNWYGGWGIQVSGRGNRVTDNTIVGLHQTQTQNETPPMAIEVFGSDHDIRDNTIGVDSAGMEFGTCGAGIKTGGRGNEFVANTIVGSRVAFPDDEDKPGGAILVVDSSPMFGQVTLQENVVKDGPGLAIEFGESIPEVLRNFPAPQITSINGTTVTGDAGACEICRVDLYLDDMNDNEEALAYLGSVEVDIDFDETTAFTFELSEPLPAGHGIRTNATTLFSGIIGTFGTGTSTALSELFVPASNAVSPDANTGRDKKASPKAAVRR